MKKIVTVLAVLLCIGLQVVQAQKRTVTGTVTSADDGGTLPGVSVIVKGTTDGAITNLNGAYKIDVEGEVTLVFSFVGMGKKEVVTGNSTVLDVELSASDVGINEIVITAVGIERTKKSLGYSISDVDADKTVANSEPDLLRSLQGKVAGVQIQTSTGVPGSASRITIRGNSSFLGNNQPLFVVDGIPYSNEQYNSSRQFISGGAYSSGISTIDPNNIETISVLKGAAAAALYGSRAANGVVVITTKSGSAKKGKKGLEVTWTSSISAEKIGSLPDYQNKYGPGTNFTYNNYNGSWGAPFESLDSIAIWDDYKDDVFGLGDSVAYVAQPDNVKDLFETGMMYENSLSISGGNEKTSFTAVASILKQDGFIPNSEFNTATLGIGGRTKLDNGLEVAANFSYTKLKSSGGLFGAGNVTDAGAAGSFVRTLWLGRNWDTSLPYEHPVTGASVFTKGTSFDNPLWSWKHNKVIDNTDRLVGSISLNYDITDWLNASYQIGVNTFSMRRQQIWDKGSKAYNGTGSILDDDVWNQEIESNFLLNFHKKITADFNVKAILGQVVNQRITDQQSFQGIEIISPGIYDIDNTINVTPNGGNYSKRRLWGMFADISFDYKNYLFLNLTGRNDRSSTLPESEASYFYPAVALSFVFTDAINIDSKILSLGKIRASYAMVGNDADPYSLMTTYAVNLGQSSGLSGSPTNVDYPFNGQPAISANNTAFDQNLTPEFTKELELGAQIGLFNDRVGIDFTWYDRKTTDQIVNIAMAPSSGFTSLITNAGELQNKGIEIGLDITPIQMNNGLRWNIFATFTKNKSEVLSLGDNLPDDYRMSVENIFSSIYPVHEVGQPYGVLRGDMVARDTEGNLLIDAATGLPFKSKNQGVVGDPNPDFLLGVTNSISFKGFTINVLIDYKHGGDIYSSSIQSMLGRGVTKANEDREDSRIIPGFYGNPDTETALVDESGNKIPNTSMVSANEMYFCAGTSASWGTNAPAEFGTYDGSVIRLREITISYQIPAKLLTKLPIGSASISFSGRNLWFKAPNFPEYTNYEPETSTFGSTNTQGLEFSSAPSVKRYGVNLKLTF